jgi:dTDP-4-amino-4,6-dideoxygalactose transaminase
MHRQPCYSFLPDAKKSFPVSEKASSEVLSLPMYPELTEAQIQTVAAAVKKAL